MSGAIAAVSRGLSWDDAKAAVLNYLRRSVPDALAALDPDNAVLDDLVEGKLREATANTFPLIASAPAQV
ncbi:hypothetical protein [Pseudogemmobacter bohemicus]|uniref:hypothetical protein n=1 Tax=Pseudogemmobacter bohemicus TaxID=2250708 RepID=UPI000DD46E9C|nr:hypothetical protein [Pseudogemmobacter bohemicus]